MLDLLVNLFYGNKEAKEIKKNYTTKELLLRYKSLIRSWDNYSVTEYKEQESEFITEFSKVDFSIDEFTILWNNLAKALEVVFYDYDDENSFKKKKHIINGIHILYKKSEPFIESNFRFRTIFLDYLVKVVDSCHEEFIFHTLEYINNNISVKLELGGLGELITQHKFNKIYSILNNNISFSKNNLPYYTMISTAIDTYSGQPLDNVIQILDYLKSKGCEANISSIQALFSKKMCKDKLKILEWYRVNFNIIPLHLSKANFFHKELLTNEVDSLETYLKYRKNRDKFWSPYWIRIPDELSLVMSECDTLKEVIIHYSGTYSKRLERIVKDNIEHYQIFMEMKWLSYLKLDADNIANFIENKSTLEYEDVEELVEIMDDRLEELSVFYTKKRILILLNELKRNHHNVHYCKDTFRMLDRVVSFNEENPDERITHLVRKPKNFKEIHDYISIITTQMKQSNFKLRGQDKLLGLEEINESGLSFKIPLKNYDLIEIGQALSICVGGGYYADKINNGSVYIVTVFKGGNLSYCIEISRHNFRIIQAKARFNGLIPSEDMAVIERAVYGVEI